MTASDLPRFTQNASTEPSEAPQGLLALSAPKNRKPNLLSPVLSHAKRFPACGKAAC